MKLSIVAFSRLIIKKHSLVRHSRHQWMKGNILLYRDSSGIRLTRVINERELTVTVCKYPTETRGYASYAYSYFDWHKEFIEEVVRPTLFRRALDEMIDTGVSEENA